MLGRSEPRQNLSLIIRAGRWARLMSRAHPSLRNYVKACMDMGEKGVDRRKPTERREYCKQKGTLWWPFFWPCYLQKNTFRLGETHILFQNMCFPMRNAHFSEAPCTYVPLPRSAVRRALFMARTVRSSLSRFVVTARRVSSSSRPGKQKPLGRGGAPGPW